MLNYVTVYLAHKLTNVVADIVAENTAELLARRSGKVEWEINFEPRLRENEFFNELVQVQSYSQYLQEIPLPPGIRQDMDRLNIVRAIRGTTGIEGNKLSKERVTHIVETDFDKGDAKSLDDLEALGAKKVLEFIRSSQADNGGRVSEALLREIHILTTKDCGYEGNNPGKYRRHNVTAGEYDCPRPEDVPLLMQKFVEYMNSRRVLSEHPVIQAILAHFYLVSIHPFGDGNGRTSRGVEAYILYNAGHYNALGFYSLANFYYQRREQYVKELQDGRFKHKGNLTTFVKFSLSGFVEELETIKQQVLDFYRVIAFRDYLNELVVRGEINQRIYDLITYLTRGYHVSLTEFRSRRDSFVASLWKDLADRTLRQDLKTMLDKQVAVIDANGQMDANTRLMDRFSASNS